jgi:serine phosphatase RsbU (regulator of sigma subunit)/anti-sigma regulatory factor (Ser/Thr protein kinase)
LRRLTDGPLHSRQVAADETSPAVGGEADPREEEGGDAIIGAAMEGLRRASEEVEHMAELAETLQRSLLPERLPDMAGLEVAARYVPGAADAQVGGDWYDVISLRDGHAGIAIGDVVGHGLDAAARMARLQNALRAYALEGLRPSLVLERMNGFAREVTGGPMATLMYGVVDPDEGRLRLATAGHPPPLVISPDADTYFAEGPAGSPLGVVPFPTYEETTIPLVPGATVLLYTDGLVERPHESLNEGLEWLRDFASGVHGGPDELCGTILQERFGGIAPRDDVALLAVRVVPVSLERTEMTLRAEPESLAQMRRMLTRWLRAVGASDTEAYEALVAAGEACANAVAHAYPPGEASYVVEATRLEDGIEIRVRDFGSWRPPRAGSQGRGLTLIDQLMDEVDIDRGRAGTIVKMKRVLRASPPQDPR